MNNTVDTSSLEKFEELIVKADEAFADEDYTLAEPTYKWAQRINPEDARPYLGIAKIALKIGRTDEALVLANEAFVKNPTIAEIHELLGDCLYINGMGYRVMDDIAKSITCHKRARDMYSKDNIAKWKDITEKIAASFNRMRGYRESSEVCEELLEEDPTSAFALSLLGVNYMYMGNFEKSENYYQRAFKVRDLDLNIINDYSMLLFFMGDYDGLQKFLDVDLQEKGVDEMDKVATKALCAMSAYIREEWDLFKKLQNDPINIEKADNNFVNKTNLMVFHNFMKCVIAYMEDNPDLYKSDATDCKKLYVFGESHCMPAAGVYVNFKGQIHKCVSDMIIGAQARHLGEGDNSNTKMSLKIKASKIPDNSEVLLTFGEIDCRRDFGIIPYLSKVDSLSEENIRSTAHDIIVDYVNFCLGIFRKKNCKITFSGVPRSNISIYNTEYEKNIQKYTIETFNELLKNHVTSANCGFVDVYGLTTSEKYKVKSYKKPGEDSTKVLDILANLDELEKDPNKKLYKKESCFIDPIHLNPRAFKEACENYLVE